MLFLLTDSPQKPKLEKTNGTLIMLFYVSPNSPQLQRHFFNLKHTEKHSSARDCWGNTKSSFIENVRTFSKNSTTQENIKILKLKEVCKTYSKRKL